MKVTDILHDIVATTLNNTIDERKNEIAESAYIVGTVKTFITLPEEYAGLNCIFENAINPYTDMYEIQRIVVSGFEIFKDGELSIGQYEAVMEAFKDIEL